MPERGITVLIFKERIMKLNKKKGFTIVELVIVIAIIAILAAVLIPTFASLIRKANESADIQACRQMNTYLAVNEVTGNKDINAVFNALKEGGMQAKDYHPLVSGRYFFWDKSLNRVLYTDYSSEKYNVLFPEEYKTATKTNGWTSLSGEIYKDTSYQISDNGDTVTITSAEQYYAFVKANKNITVKTIKFNANEIDFMGADIGIEYTQSGIYNLEGKADTNGTVLKGFTQLKANYVGNINDNKDKDYACGLIQLVKSPESNKNTITVNVQNITISKAVIGDLEVGGVGAVIGKAHCATVNLTKVKVLDSTVNGRNKVGALVGQLESKDSSLVVTNCEINNVTVNCSEGEAGKVVGCISYNGTATFDKAFNIWVKGVTLNLVEGKYTRKVVTLPENSNVKITANNTTTDLANTEGVTAVVEKLNDAGAANGHRLFYKNAYVLLEYEKNPWNVTSKVIVGTSTLIELKKEKVEATERYSSVVVGEGTYTDMTAMCGIIG